MEVIRTTAGTPVTLITDVLGTTCSLADIWTRCCFRLRSEIGEDVFKSWFGGLKLEQVTAGRANFTIATRFLKSWLESHYREKIVAALNAEMGGVDAIQIAVRSSGSNANNMPPLATGSAAGKAAEIRPTFEPIVRKPPATVSLHGSPLDPRLTLATLVVGNGNRFAVEAARCVAAHDPLSQPAFNPLFIHAPVGFGKTHLLQAIAHAAIAEGRSVLYLTAEKFMYSFVSSLQAQTALAFKDAIVSADIAIFDDVQFLQGKAMQGEFDRTLKRLISAGKRFVLAADRPPGELETLNDLVRLLVTHGLSIEIGGLDEDQRREILKTRFAAAKQQHPAFEVSDEVLAFVARTIMSDGRNLEGAANRVIAHSVLLAKCLTVEDAGIAIKDLIQAREPKRLKIEDIQKLVATHYSVSRTDMLSSRRTAAVVKPRQIAMYLSKTLTLRSLPEIGRRFGGRDHTTVLHAVRKIDGLCKSNPELNSEIELLKRMLAD